MYDNALPLEPSSVWNIGNPNDERNSYSEETLDRILDRYFIGNSQIEFEIRTGSCNVVQKFNKVKFDALNRAMCLLGVDMRNLLTKICISSSLVSTDLHTFFNSGTHQVGLILSLDNMGFKV